TRARVVPRTQPLVYQPARPLSFQGQNPGERVVWIKRQSKWILLATGAPLLLGVLALVVLHFWIGEQNQVGRTLQIVGIVVLALLTLRWAVTDFWNWFFSIYVLTDQRAVAFRGFFNRLSEEVPIKSVTQVVVERPSPLYVFFGIGDLLVRPLGSPVHMPGLAHPRDVADSILEMQANPNYGLPPQVAQAPAAPRLRVRSKKLQDDLDELAKPAPMPATPPPRGLTSFNAFLHRKIPIKFIEGESVVQVVYRHWFILLRNELPAIIILIAGIALSVLLRNSNPQSNLPGLLAGLAVLISLVVGALIYMNWADDVFILTTHRVIDIDRLFFLLAEYSNDAPYARVQHVHVERNWLGMLLGFGSIVVETSGRRYPLNMTDVPHAFSVMDNIFSQINLLRERDSVIAINKQKKENYLWMATILGDLVTEVPDVRGLTVIEAAGRARAAGLKLVVDVERAAPGVAAGVVLEQSPTAGTSALNEGELRVVLSRQGVAATP
ncbi:MAG: PH domain-containing protein, partial [Ktedonobacterales bacterium]